MQKQFLLLCFGIFLFSTAISQPWPYVISSTTQPFVNLVNPISLNNGNIWTFDSLYSIPLNNFDFEVDGIPSLSVQTQGSRGIKFNGTFDQWLFGYSSVYAGVTQGSLLKDKGTTSSLSPISYEISGSPGSQILKIEWLNAGFNTFWCTDTAAYASYQIWLFESDDHLELHYGPSNTDSVTFPGAGGPFVSFKCYGNYGVFISHNQSNPIEYWADVTQPNYSPLNAPPDSVRVFIISHNPLFSGLNEQNALSEIGLSPNPSDGVFNFTSGKFLTGTYTIIDSKGMELLNRTVDNEITTVDLAGFPDGLYFIRVKNEHDVAYQKMIKQ